MTPLISRTLQALGYANLLWSRVEVLWYLYFTTLLPDTPRPAIDALYRSHETGNRKRLLISSLVALVHADGSAELAAFRAAMAQTGQAAPFATRSFTLTSISRRRVEQRIFESLAEETTPSRIALQLPTSRRSLRTSPQRSRR